jgi:hypothetical protein
MKLLIAMNLSPAWGPCCKPPDTKRNIGQLWAIHVLRIEK